MYTYEMIAKALEDGLTYKSGQMIFQREKGFIDSDGAKWDAIAFDDFHDEYGRTDLYAFIMTHKWQLVKRKTMTIEEIENELGYCIEVVK